MLNLSWSNFVLVKTIWALLRSFSQQASLARGVSIRMLHWLGVSKIPSKYFIICFWWVWNGTICVLTYVLTCRECHATTKNLLFEYLTFCLKISSSKNLMFLSFSCCYAELELVKFCISQNHLSYAQIIFSAGFTGQGVSIRMLHWLGVARTPAKYLIMCIWQTQNMTICVLCPYMWNYI